MNAHITSEHNAETHRMFELVHKMETALHSPRVWQICAAVLIIALIVMLMAFAEVFSGSSQNAMPYYGYPSYPAYPLVP